MALDMSNEFVQTETTVDRYKIIMKIRGQLVNIILEIFQECTISMSGTKEVRIFSTYGFSKYCMEC